MKPSQMKKLQINISLWVKRVFGKAMLYDKTERSLRFIEEAVELVQACNLPVEAVLNVVEYVYSRPKGDIEQEVGGVALTLAALCEAQGQCLETAATGELARVHLYEDLIKAKNKNKPRRVKSEGAA